MQRGSDVVPPLVAGLQSRQRFQCLGQLGNRLLLVLEDPQGCSNIGLARRLQRQRRQFGQLRESGVIRRRSIGCRQFLLQPRLPRGRIVAGEPLVRVVPRKSSVLPAMLTCESIFSSSFCGTPALRSNVQVPSPVTLIVPRADWPIVLTVIFLLITICTSSIDLSSYLLRCSISKLITDCEPARFAGDRQRRDGPLLPLLLAIGRQLFQHHRAEGTQAESQWQVLLGADHVARHAGEDAAGNLLRRLDRAAGALAGAGELQHHGAFVPKFHLDERSAGRDFVCQLGTSRAVRRLTIAVDT